jgi:hypothetical protein
MSSLWYQAGGGADLAWRAIGVDAEIVDLRTTLELPLRITKFGGREGSHDVALLVRGRPAAWINGRPVLGGMKILAHRDELLIDGRPLFYSDESVPVVRSFELADNQRRPRCAVCRQNVENGQSIVECPRCGRVFHQIAASANCEAKLCWTYRPACLCLHPTHMDPDAVWRPEKELDDGGRL